jgi:glycosyltransferase involved in cell wall biosynthesis
MPRKRILLLLPDLAGGGAERTSLNLQRHLDASRYEVILGLMEPKGEYLALVDSGAWIAPAGIFARMASGRPKDSVSRGLLQVPLLAALLNRHRPDVVMSSMADVSIPLAAAWNLLPSLRRKVRWIAREGNYTSAVVAEAFSSPSQRRLMRRMIATAYRTADVVLTPCRGVAEGLAEDFDVPRGKLAVIGNPLDLEAVARGAREAPAIALPEKFLVAVGRLKPQKGFDLLIRAFAALGRDDLSLVILGEGPERAGLQALAGELGVAERVVMPGFLVNPWPVVARAEVFCLSSRWEGFGHVVIEAMACGTPVVVTDCPHGPGEIVTHGLDGITVRNDNWQALSDGIHAALEIPDTTRARAEAARHRASDFEAGRIAARYGDLFDGIMPAAETAP